jgi:O-antigen ligase
MGLISLFYTENLQVGLQKVETKASLLLIPMVIASLPNLKNHFKFVGWFHVWGNVLALVICLIAAVLRFFENGEFIEFFYSRFSIIEHPGYFTMNVIFALSFVGVQFNKHEKNYSKTLLVSIFSFLLIGVFLLSSRTGIIALPFVLVLILSNYLAKRFSLFKVFVANIVLIIVLFASIFFIPNVNMRMTSLINEITTYKNPSEATDAVEMRIAIWTQSRHIIYENWLLGVGLGDTDDQLAEVYKKMNMQKPLTEGYNAHNQFLQTQLSIGIFGTLAQLGILIFLFIFGFKKRNALALCLFIIISSNFLTESILERQSGVVFFSLFVPILLNFKETKNEK